MTLIPSRSVYQECQRKHLSFRHVAEVGVYQPQTSNIYDFIVADIRTTLVEADPATVAAINTHFAGRTNISLHPVAVYDRSGQVELMQRGASTFVNGDHASPAKINDAYRPEEQDKLLVDAKTFDEIDDGTIELLSVDIEGCDWYVLKHMLSRPGVISIETHGGSYVNPFLSEIEHWMRTNHYRAWYKDDSDTVYARRDVLASDPRERLNLHLTDLLLGLSRAFSRFKRLVRGQRVPHV